MIPDFEKRLKDKIDQASLKELMPEFDNEQEWMLLQQKLLLVKRKLLIPVWSYAAAILILCSVAGLTLYLSVNNRRQAHSSYISGPASNKVTKLLAVEDTNRVSKLSATDAYSVSKPALSAVKKTIVKHKEKNGTHEYLANEIIHNGTPCPIELRISQVMSCPNNQPKAISSSSTLEPDESGQLHYKENNTVGRNCSLTIKQIEIESVATGETILLNSISTPATAQEVFSYITREKRGDVLAGMFNSDCNKKGRKHSLRLDNRDGNLVIE